MRLPVWVASPYQEQLISLTRVMRIINLTIPRNFDHYINYNIIAVITSMRINMQQLIIGKT